MSGLREQVGSSVPSPATQMLLQALSGTTSTTAFAASPKGDPDVFVCASVE